MSLGAPGSAAVEEDLPEKHGGDLGRAGAQREQVRLWLRLLSCAMAVDKRLRAMLAAEHATTLPRFDILAALARAPGGLTMSELSAALLVSNGNVTALVRALARDGLVACATGNADRRVQLVTLTASGRRAFEAQALAHHALIGRLFAQLTPADTQALHALLGRLKASVAAA
jgi:DNA-binding MarR family transcriptional regulator